MQPAIATTVTDLCGKRVYVTRTRWDKHVSWTETAHEGVVHAVSYVCGGYGGYTFLIAVDREMTLPDGTKKMMPTLEHFSLGDGTGIVLADPPGVQYGRSLDEIAPLLISEDTSRSYPCPKCAVSAGFRCVNRSGEPVPVGYMHSERGSAT